MTTPASVIIIQREQSTANELADCFEAAGAKVLETGITFADLEFAYRRHAIKQDGGVDGLVLDTTFPDRVSVGFALGRLSAAAKKADCNQHLLPVLTLRGEEFSTSEQDLDRAIIQRLSDSKVQLATISKPICGTEIEQAILEIQRYREEYKPTEPEPLIRTFGKQKWDKPSRISCAPESTDGTRRASLPVEELAKQGREMMPYHRLVLRSLALLSISEPGFYFSSNIISEAVRSDPNFFLKAGTHAGNARSVSSVLRLRLSKPLVMFKRVDQSTYYMATDGLKQILGELE